ncbi:hypothetical protein DNTS_029440 [Danionella cerebrum]|uniref:Uncharacterized protein n=1 Tax=Danionella cerebrum TaxID=2873325 RepID=A0A553RBZ4_9TELE|nr:hypothetical protein DNTS_029440 [Danionella translucida]
MFLELQRAVKSTHVSLTGSSTRAELSVTFRHLICRDFMTRLQSLDIKTKYFNSHDSLLTQQNKEKMTSSPRRS